MRILTVAKNRQDRQTIEDALRSTGHQPEALFSRGREALVHVQHNDVDLVITTRRLEDMDGPSFACAMKRQDEGHVPVLMICEQIREDELIDALDQGIDNVLLQPFRNEDLHDKAASLTTPAFELPCEPFSGQSFRNVEEDVSDTLPDPHTVSSN